MDIEELNLLNKTIEEKEINFIKKYRSNPNYLKIPLYIFEKLKSNYLKQLGSGYSNGRFTYNDLYICETPTIEKIEEIEVF